VFFDCSVNGIENMKLGIDAAGTAVVSSKPLSVKHW
jgi:hypothetical protein